MPEDGKEQHDDQTTADHAIATFRATADRAIGEWSDQKLNAVIARLRQDSRRRPDSFALLMFLEDARLRRHELRATLNSDGKGAQEPNIRS
jgi:hypothetical protein